MTAGHSPPEPPKPWLTAAVEPTGLPAPDIPPPVPGSTGITNTQPTFVAWLVTVAPPAVYALATAFHWFTLTREQLDALAGIYGVVLTGAAWWVHARVYAPATVAKIVTKGDSQG